MSIHTHIGPSSRVTLCGFRHSHVAQRARPTLPRLLASLSLRKPSRRADRALVVRAAGSDSDDSGGRRSSSGVSSGVRLEDVSVTYVFLSVSCSLPPYSNYIIVLIRMLGLRTTRYSRMRPGR